MAEGVVRPRSGRRPGGQTVTSAVRMITHPPGTTVTGRVKGLLPGPEPAPGRWIGLRVGAAATRTLDNIIV